MQWFNNATGQVLLTVLTALCAFAEAAAYAFFCLWYTFWGAILWGIGPLLLRFFQVRVGKVRDRISEQGR